MIRIISGTYKGKRLKRVPSPLVRPMPDKLKESLFSILRETVRGRAFLDAFAGTGSVGIEALSRGADKAVFIEEYPRAVRIIKENLAKVGAEDRALVVAREYNRAVIELARDGFLFDLVFLDPPYKLLDERIRSRSSASGVSSGRAEPSSSGTISRRSRPSGIFRWCGRSPSATTPCRFSCPANNSGGGCGGGPFRLQWRSGFLRERESKWQKRQRRRLR